MAKQAKPKKDNQDNTAKPVVQATASKKDTPSTRRWGLMGVLVLALVAAGLGINNWMRFDKLPDWQADISALHSAIAELKSAQKNDTRESRINALETQIAQLESTLREIQSRPAPTNSTATTPTNNFSTISNAARNGTAFAEILGEAVAVDARWQVLEKWAQHPPPSLDQLWQEMQTRIPETIPETPAIESQGWLAPLTKIIQLRPLNPREDLADALIDAIARRDSTDALQAIRALSGNPQDMLAWQQAYAARIALNQTLDRLMRETEQ